jgi:hypothetical protein
VEASPNKPFHLGGKKEPHKNQFSFLVLVSKRTIFEKCPGRDFQIILNCSVYKFFK